MNSEEKPMRIAVIGGGRRCKAFLEMLDARRFPRLNADIVAVADHDEQAVGMQMAKSKGIFTTSDYHDFFKLKDLDLIIELTGNESLLEDFIANNPAKVRILEAAISRLFGDMIRFREEYLLDRRQLELVESLVESIFSSIQDQVLIMLPNRKILDANEALLNSLGLKQQQIVGKYCYQVTHQAIRPCNESGHNCPLQESLDSGTTAHAIHEHFDRNNQPAYCEVTTIPLKNSAGEIELVLEVVRDITDELEKRVEQKTRIVTHNLAKLVHEDKMIALGKLVASAVHEINNPLSGINALARLMHQQLEEGPPNGEELKQLCYYMQLIDMESARCSKIVSNLLSFSRQQKMERKEFQLNELIEKVVLLFKHKIELQNIHLNVDLSPELPPMVGDPGQIQQCLVNLFFNAMEALPGGGEINVRTCWEASKHAIRLEVEDSGEGIPQEMLSQIFEPFFSTKNQDKGVGLGLSVVYGIIKEHHGSIFVKSEVGKGSNFIVRFFLLSDEGGRDDVCSAKPRS